MPNLHTLGPDTLAEEQAIDYDLLPVVLLTHSGLTVPGSGLALANVTMTGYVRRGTALVYVSQAARTITLSGSAGTYWVGLVHDTHSATAGYTRVPGSHYVWQGPSGTQPANPSGGLVVASVVVTGSNITSVTPLTGIASPLMSQQHADAVAITGGTAVLADLSVDSPTLTVDHVNHRVGIGTAAPGLLLQVAGRSYFSDAMGLGTAPDPLLSLLVQFNARFQALVGIGMAPAHPLSLRYTRASQHALYVWPDADTGAGTAATFLNAAQASVGSITTTATATSYNTTSDRRLKFGSAPLVGALSTLRQLKPSSFFWLSNNEKAHGFFADELMTVIPEAVTGQPDAVDAQGNVLPQGVDASKLVVFLVGAVQELLTRVEMLEELLTTP